MTTMNNGRVSFGCYILMRKAQIEQARKADSEMHVDVKIRIDDEVREFDLDDFMRRLGFGEADWYGDGLKAVDPALGTGAYLANPPFGERGVE